MPAEFKTERIEFRVRPNDKDFIEEAARHLGMSVSDFLVSSAREHAEEVIRRRDQIALSRRDQETFVNALLNPPVPNKALRDAVAEYRTSVE